MDSTSAAPMAGKTVLVTGASAGIGKATALGLARMGARLAITGRDRRRVATQSDAVKTSTLGAGSTKTRSETTSGSASR